MVIKSFSSRYPYIVLFPLLVLLSCCVSTNKTAEIQKVDEKEPSNVLDYETRINNLYAEMRSDVQSRDIAFTSANVPWLETFSDDGKYFYAIGTSEFCSSEKAASSAAVNDAKQTMKRNAIKISGKTDFSVVSYELVSRKNFRKNF